MANLVTIAEQVGAPRIVPGGGIQHPSGAPSLPPDAERAWRRALLERALEAITTVVEQPTIFDVEELADA